MCSTVQTAVNDHKMKGHNMADKTNSSGLVLYMFILLLSAFSTASFAQGFNASIKAGVAFPVGNFSDAAGTGAGGEGSIEYMATPNLGLLFTAGYYSFGAKDDTPGMDYSFSTLPLLLGARYYFTNMTLQPYIGADAGLHFLTAEVTTTTVLGESSVKNDETKFGIAPVLGLVYYMPPNFSFDLAAKYNHIFTEDEATGFITVIAGFKVVL